MATQLGFFSEVGSRDSVIGTTGKKRPAGNRYCCAWCKVLFKKKQWKNKGSYCSRACAFADKEGWKKARARPRQAKVQKPYPLCVMCGLACPSRARKTCSGVCRRRYLNRVSALALKARRHARYPLQTKRTTCRNRTCGRSFVYTFRKGQGRRHYCSPQCARRDARRGRHTHEHRARHAGVACDYRIKPEHVFTRDRWRCQLCGCRTPKRLRGKNKPTSPELDHIVPIAMGGGHTWDNVQCACRKCNMRKNAKPLGQMRLAV